jgi:hypothetical protein
LLSKFLIKILSFIRDFIRDFICISLYLTLWICLFTCHSSDILLTLIILSLLFIMKSEIMNIYFCQVKKESGLGGRVKATMRTTSQNFTISNCLINWSILCESISNSCFTLRSIRLRLAVWTFASFFQQIFDIIFAECLIAAFTL